MNIYQILLKLTRIHGNPETLARVLEALGAAVCESSSEINRAKESRIDGYIDAVVDDECAFIESLIGAALVASQARITSVVSSIKRVHKRAEKDGHVLRTTDGSKRGLLVFGGSKPSTHSQIQFIDAFANYFKHHDEWTGPWSAVTGQSKSTISVISAAGATEGSTGILRTGAHALGIDDYEKLIPLSEIVRSWAATLVTSYERELRAVKLL